MTDREKLIELMFSYQDEQKSLVVDKNGLADYLLSHGVTVRESGRWKWDEKWRPHHCGVELLSCGWYCPICGIELGEYMTKATGEHHYLDDDVSEPKLNFCPNCGAPMKGDST